MSLRLAAASLLSFAALPAQAHWIRLYPATSPSPRMDAASTYDEVRHQMLLFGGQTAQITNEFWRFDGNNWTQIVGSAPPARVSPGLCFDSGRGVTVLFGGFGNNVDLHDTWEWNGSAWSLHLPVHSAPGRRGMALAYDPVRACSVMFGGIYHTGPFLFQGDTWTWDGNDWTLQAPARAPAPRAGARIAFDPVSRSMLLFGGSSSGIVYDDTWRWDGLEWQLLQPPIMPFARSYHAMATDLARQRIVLYAGSSTVLDPYIWEWDGSTWLLQQIASPTPRSESNLAYATDRRELWMFGGGHSSLVVNDTWVYRTDQPADYTPFGSGCAGSLGTPRLDHAQYGLPWLGDRFTIELRSAAANAGVLLVTGFTAPPPISLAPFGMPGCDWYVSNDSASFRISDAAGTATWTLPLPNVPALAGATLHQQAFALDAVNAAGAVVSNAAHLRAGVR